MVNKVHQNIIILLLASITLYACKNEKPIIVNGYTNKVSYTQQDTITFYVNASQQKKTTLPILAIDSTKFIDVSVNLFSQQTQNNKPWQNGFGYKPNGFLPANILSPGIYFTPHIGPFIIKNATAKADVLVVYPSNTVNAYNKSGGRSSYTNPKGAILSYNRPTNIQKYCAPFLKWIHQQNIPIDYIADSDLDDYKNIEGYKVIIIPGHSEYWTRKARLNFDQFVNQGGNAIVLSGNTMWWQVRYSNNQMIITKDAQKDNNVPDSLKTILWNDTSLHYPIMQSICADFEHGGFGLKKDKGWDGYLIVKDSPLFANTGIAVGDTLLFPSAEHDGAPITFHYGTPIIDTTKLHFYKQALLGYDKTYRLKNTYATFIVFQKTPQSGTIINVGSTNWCSTGFTGRDGDKIKKLTYNFIDFLVKGKEVF